MSYHRFEGPSEFVEVVLTLTNMGATFDKKRRRWNVYCCERYLPPYSHVPEGASDEEWRVAIRQQVKQREHYNVRNSAQEDPQEETQTA